MGDTEKRFFVVTGGPGSGKSSLIDRLQRNGYAGSVEAGLGIIQDQVIVGGTALPWSDPNAFRATDAELGNAVLPHCAACRRTGVLRPRGARCVGIFAVVGCPRARTHGEGGAVFRYYRRVFITPPWQEIFQQDRERKQGFDEAVRTYDVLVATYTTYGYELVEIPRVSVEQRVRFVLQSLGLHKSTP